MMKAIADHVRTGKYFWAGNIAIAEGCIAAGCQYFGGYPITPSSEVAEHMARRLPEVGGTFIQFEDELGSITSVLGASWAGDRSMTATSGPGMSLMMETIGLAAMTETPCVIVNVQRGGPSTGLPTLVGQQDVMQAKYGSHGDYEIIALSPDSVQEAFELSIDAFNLADQYRTPVIMLTDESVGHLTEGIEVPPAESIQIIPRKKPQFAPGTQRYYPYEVTDGSLIPPMAHAGEGYKIQTTGLTHDERGYPVITEEVQEKLVRRICDKIRRNVDKIIKYEMIEGDDAEILVLAYGITARAAKVAIKLARKEGIKAGFLRLITIWPFPEELIRNLASTVSAFIVAEINYGQIVKEVERCVAGQAPVYLSPRLGGGIHNPLDILEKIREAKK
ncbi:MAG: 2-oxoacid:acceptor oxidoreductase subunit alpha [Candidatus Hermodarchaeia archaeon]|jgi:2-oxoglutarate ferredoxin oxidoreductase subunit alpha